MKKVSPTITLILCILTFSFSPNLGQTKTISLDEVYKKYTFHPRSVRGINSMADGRHYTIANSVNTIDKYRYSDGEKVEVIFDVDDYANIEAFSNYEFSRDEQYILLTTASEQIYRHSYTANYFIFNRKEKTLKPLSANGRQQLATLSPDNKYAAFVRNNNIFIHNLKTQEEKQITFDGKKNEIINGAPDWVYEEEFGFADGFKWSPDGKRIAFYRFDEKNVKEYFMSLYGDLYPKAYKFKYPKAGEANSKVSIHIYEVGSNKTTEINIPDSEEYYIPRIKWTNDPTILSIIWLNRLQNKVKVLHANSLSGKSTVVYEEENEKYISEATDDMLTYLPDNESFLLISERDKYFHFYQYNFKNQTIMPVTKGNWDINSLVGVDMENEVVYYNSYEEGPTEIQLYSIHLDGSKKKKISTEEGVNSAIFSSTYDYYILNHSSANTVPTYTLYNRKGKKIRVLEDNKNLAEAKETYGYAPIEFMKVPTKSGQLLNGYMIKPKDFNPEKKYPLFIYVYGGPESQNVVNRWNYRSAWFQMLTQEGYIVACIDNRGTNGRGEDFRKSTYMQLGKLETIDQVESAKYLGDLNYIDNDRIGIFGWSYGGFMTSLCLTKGKGTYKMGIAVAPVTNWRYYDTIYTERFMRTPQENPEGYDKNSPINFADQLQGKFLLVHGTADDNVHLQNSIDFISALVQADKQFEMQFYPNCNHGIYGGNTTYHLYKRMTDFILQNL